MGPLTPRRVPIEGNSWRESSADIAVAGLGWLGIGVKGRAAFHVWTPEGASTPALHFFLDNILPEAVVQAAVAFRRKLMGYVSVQVAEYINRKCLEAQ